ncbi:hypothetical protein AO915_32605, partial [Pseudomonas aeruginosa]
MVHTSIEHSRDWCRSLLILNCQELAAQQPLRPINWCSRLLKMTPSAVSVGLCLVHVACDKRPWLEGLNVEMDWQMSGKPLLLYLDNAAEFKSEALRRGCEQHGIRLDYRPLGQPHYGGIVER